MHESIARTTGRPRRRAARLARASVAVGVAVLAAGCTSVSSSAPPPPPPSFDRVDVSSLGVAGDAGCCITDGLVGGQSSDGRYVLFNSLATNLVPGDTNGVALTLAGKDWFVRDRVAGTTQRVSVLPGGGEVANWLGTDSRVRGAGMSRDARYVVFEVGNHSTEPSRIYRFDRNTGQSVLVRQFGPGDPSIWPQFPIGVSNSGQIITFVGGSFGTRSIVLNGATGVFTDVGTAAYSPPRLSADGRYVAADDYVHDRQSATSTPIVPGGAEAQDVVESMSADGHHVLFWSNRVGLTPTDTNAVDDLFEKNTVTGVIRLVSSGGGTDGIVPSVGWTVNRYPYGQTFVNGRITLATISDDGNTVAFSTDAPDVVEGDNNGTWDTFVTRLTTGATTRVTATYDAFPRWASQGGDIVSGDGTRVLLNGARSGVAGLWSQAA